MEIKELIGLIEGIPVQILSMGILVVNILQLVIIWRRKGE